MLNSENQTCDKKFSQSWFVDFQMTFLHIENLTGHRLPEVSKGGDNGRFVR